MRRFGIVLTLAALAMVAFCIAGNAQQGGGKKGKGGFGFGGFGGGMGKMDPLALLRMPDVKKELDLSEEQDEKLPGAVMKAIASVLTDKQMKRFRQIELQSELRTSLQPFVKNEELRKQLNLTSAQVKSIEEIVADVSKEAKEIQKEEKGFGAFGKIQALNKEAKDKVMSLLTADQKKAFTEAVGEEFKFPTFGGKGKKKADTN